MGKYTYTTSQVSYRNGILRHEHFLRLLYKDSKKNCSARIKLASEPECDVLLKALHFLGDGKIKIKSDQFKKIEKSKRLSQIRKLENEDDLNSFLEKPLKDKQKFLANLASVMPNILSSHFNLVE